MAGRQDGFTLIEALVAFAIVAALSLVVQRGLIQSRVGWAAVEDRTGAERLARSLLEEPLTPAAVAAGGREGVTDGRRWRIGLQTLDLPLPNPPEPETGAAPPPQPAQEGPRWLPLRVRIEVATARGRSVEVETVRLAPFPARGP
ncbi:type II secretion system protein [Methylorubrum salsuginis]|uniref:Prepilin-type N-terminal cleavage/methylation domain-containing protein n=1 Tax=Methylorubrum salsuginis TaxID=414703 RepID=A0A1I4ACP3_9HYPH|nr:type II secretion system protein [Methylorubrum salsuginis]SFK54094.1 prepilin-type N-terminal cleavage/methylation domain-containing protein [Methylorubrum salsuginis]